MLFYESIRFRTKGKRYKQKDLENCRQIFFIKHVLSFILTLEELPAHKNGVKWQFDIVIL